MHEPGLPTNRLDAAFARFLSQRSLLLKATDKAALGKLLLRLSAEQNQGHNCIAITDQEHTLLLASGVADGSGQLPLVVEPGRLYLQRYWQYEHHLATRLRGMLVQSPTVADEDLSPLLARYFPNAATTLDWQCEAAKSAVRQRFCLITGGPGTGKTTTVVKILAVLQELAAQPLLIALAAPTGKAAMRLQEAIGARKADLPCPDTVKHRIPDTVTTLHRLLGAQPPSPYFRHHAGQPLIYDLVVVDEASMVDLALMAKLVAALKPSARLILLGDKDQLASVESGAVLADLGQSLPAQTVELKVAHRFGGAIKALADAVNRQDCQAVIGLLQQGDAACRWLDGDWAGHAAQQHGEYLRLWREGAEFFDIFQQFSAFQVLCANRQGSGGVADANARISQALAGQGWLQPTGAWYPGRPVLVLQNQPAMQLYNGDIGLCLPDQALRGKLMVFFQRPDGSVKKYLPARLPPCETAFALTVHKSQGSEFAEVLILLPDTVNPVLTKELLYTALTRAKTRLSLVASAEVLGYTVAQKVARVTGLGAKLQSPLA